MTRNKDKCVRTGLAVLSAAIFAASVLIFSGGAYAGGKKAELGSGLYLGDGITMENLTVWPVYSKRPVARIDGEFITLAAAEEKGKAVVREVGKSRPSRRQMASQRRNMVQSSSLSHEPDGVVGELVIENKGEKPILVLAGTLLKGGKQDRQVGQDFVVPPKKTVPVSAFCVEHGRWSAKRKGKHTGGVFKAQKALATKSVRKSGQYDSNQSAVWANVAKENKKAGKAPGSGTLLAAVEEADSKSNKRRARISKTVTDKFSKLAKEEKKPVGLAYALDGKVKEVRSFTHPRIFERFTQMIFSTVAMEADLAQREAEASRRPIHTEPAEPKQVVDLVQSASKIKAKKVKTKAGNINRMRKGDKVMSSDCFADELAAEPVTSSFMSAE